MQLGDRLIVNESYLKMAQNMANLQSGMNNTDARWAEMSYQSDQEKLRPDYRLQGAKVREELATNFRQRSHSPNMGMKIPHDQRDIRTDRGPEPRVPRREDMVSNLDYFMHNGYPYQNFNLQARRDSPPDLMAAERAKQAYARGNEGYLSGPARSMPPDLSKITPEQLEALYKSQNMGISVTISPPELSERSGILPPGSRAGMPNQRPSPQAEMQQHHGDFGRNIPFMGMEDKLLRIAESANLQKARAEMNAQNVANIFPGMVRMPPSSQVQNFPNINIHQQNNMRFNSELIHQAGAFPFGMDPRLFEHNRVFPMSAAASRSEHPSPGETSSQTAPGGSNEANTQKKSFHGPSRPMALGPNFVPQGHLPLNIAQGTPSSEDMSSASPAGSSPYAEFGTPSPNSDESARLGTKQKAKSRTDGSNQCSQCGKVFSSSSALAKHKLIHSDERRYICQICSKGFKRQDHLNGHMITHRDKKPYECQFSECDKSYSDMRSLKRHLENHHGVPPVSSSPTLPHTSSISHHTSQSSVNSTSNLLVPTVMEDRNNNMKGIVPPERPSSAPNTAVPEVRTRTRIRSNSCEDIHTNHSESEARSEKEARDDDVTVDVEDDIFEEPGPKKGEPQSTLSERPGSSVQASNVNRLQSKNSNNFDPNMVSPNNPMLQQWPTKQYPGANFPVSWSNAQSQWNNAQLLASMNMAAQGQGNLPFFMGYRQPFQQLYPPGCFPGGPNDPTSQMEASAKKSKADVIASSQAAFAQNALQMFASMAAQRTPIPTDMLLQQGMGCYPGNQSSTNKATNPAAIAIAAAKDASMFCVPRDMRLYGAHPGAAQWQDVLKDDNVAHERDIDQNTLKSHENENSKRNNTEKHIEKNQNNHQEIPQTLAKDNTRNQTDRPSPNKVSVLTVNVNASPTKDPSTVSPRRKPRPHPGPIIIPASVNNRVTHSVTFSGSTTRPVSPIKMDFHRAPIYTPPPMLSPRSIFFTGTSCGTPRSAVPLTPGRLLLSARRLSTNDASKEEESEPVAIPEPKINVGPQFQAEVKRKTLPRENAHKDEHRATLMWAPLKEDRIKKKEVDNFFEMACSTAFFGGSSNKEYASHVLHRTRGNVKEATRLLLARRHILRADDPTADYHYTGSSRWTAKERLTFREAYRTKGKNFHLIQKEVATKTVHQCVEFYYLWKATNPEGFRARTRYVEMESEQEEEEVTTPSVFETPLATGLKDAIFQCDYPECQARFVSRQALNGHIRVHGGSFGKPIEVRKPRQKPHVIITTSIQRDGSIAPPPPKRKKSPSPAPPNPGAPSDGPPLQFACKVCGRVFSKVKSRSAHMKTHVPKKPDGMKHKNLNPPPLVANA